MLPRIPVATAAPRVAALVGVLLLVGAGCSIGQSDHDAYTSAAAKAMLNTTGFPLTTSQTRCFARRLVDEIGTSTLQHRGITPQQVASGSGLAKVTLSPKQVQVLEPALFDGGCLEFTTLAEQLLRGAGSTTLTATQRRCVANGLSNDPVFRRGFTVLLSQTSASDSSAGAKLSNVFTHCGVTIKSG